MKTGPGVSRASSSKKNHTQQQIAVKAGERVPPFGGVDSMIVEVATADDSGTGILLKTRKTSKTSIFSRGAVGS